MPQENLYTQILDLDSLDVYLETPVNDESYFSIRGLPEQLGYGKHFFTLTYKDPANQPLLATNSSIVFEFVDSNGTVVFSELADIPDTSGAATGYIWIKEDPLRTAENIFDGELTMYVVGTVEGVPSEWEGRRNLRSSFQFEIRKNKPNLSPIMLYDPDGVIASSSFTETLEADLSRGVSDISYNRGYINVSASHLQTQGGKIKFAELSYLESGSRSGDFTLLNTFELENDTARFEVDKSGSQGINPISTTFKTPIPKEIRRDTPVKFKLRYLDENKTPAQYYDENRLNEQIIITSSEITVNGSPQIIERADNLLRGSMYTGNAVGKGFEQSGRSSAYIKSVDYTGFISASTHLGKSGIMMFSGSVLSSSGDEYQGVGLELVGDSESYFRFRSNPSVLDIKTREFFVGTQNTQFISASGGQIEISSSRFHLTRDGDVFYSGSIDASGGRIGGFEISSSRIQSTNRDLILKGNGQISASAILLASSSFQIDFNDMSRFGSDGFQSFVMADDTGVRIQTSDFNLNTARFIISSSDVGVMAMGSTPPTAFNSGKGIYMSGDGEFLAGDSNGERMQFNGFNLVLSSSAFFLGNQDSFMSGSQGKILISGSDIGIQTPRFFFGDASKFISGSLGNLEISSSRFHLSRDGNVKLIGRIEADSGLLGGFGITQDAITGSNIIMSGSPAIGGTDHPRFMFISSSNFNLKENGDMTASAILFSGGQIGGFDLSDDLFNSKNDKLILKSNGQITGSDVKFTGGKIAAFNLSDDALSTDSFFISASATGTDLFISASSFNVSAQGVVTASALSLEGGDVGGLSVANGTIAVGEILKLKDSGQITASNAQLTGKITATSGQIAGWSIVGDTLVGNNATLDGAGAALFKSDQGPGSDTGAALDQLRNEYYIDFTPTGSDSSNFFIKMGPNFMVDKDGILIASGATFIGTITASAGLIGGFSSDDHSLKGSNFFISGGASGNERFISTSNFNVKASGNITGSQVLFTGGTIGGFELSSTQINSTNDNLILKSSGQITASNAQIQGKITATSGEIGGFAITSNAVSSSNGNLKLKSSGQITGSQVLFTGGKIADFTIDGHSLTTTGVEINDSSQTLFISSSAFKVKHTGEITGSQVLFSGGKIGGFTINSSTITATNFTLDPSNKFISLGSGDDIFIADADDGIQLGDATFADAPFSVTKGGALKATSGTIGGFTLSANELTATNFELDPSGKRITLGAGTDIFIADGDEGIQLGHGTFASAPFSVTKAGFIKSTTGEIGGFRINSSEITSSNDALILRSRGEITGSQVLFTGGRVAGFTLSGDTLTANNFLLDAGNQKMTLGSGNEIFIADGDVGINLGNSSFASSPFSVTKAGVLKAISGTIGGWNLGSDRIFSDNINITSAGTIETSDFASGVKGWRISALNNGTAEFENAVIRGTMKTAVFEKETVNAVGGQLYVANSTVLSGSGTISASFNTMSVDNVSGFTGSYGGAGEILSLKKITDTGFSTEYVFVQSASRLDPSSDTNFSGKLFVIRGYSGSIQSDSSSLGDNPNPAQDYEPGQVIVSTGISGSGFIRINANPTTNETPYIDIVERTGSAIYDVELKARLGDLSGLSSAKVGTQGGFGLFTERAFLTKDVTVGTLGTEHITIDATSLKFLDNETTMAELRGTTWTLGGAHGSTDDAIVMSPDNGVKIFDNSNNFVTVDSTGLTVTQSGAGVAKFASTTTIGNTSTEHVELTSTSLKLKDGSTTRLSMDSSGMQIGSVSNGITLDSSGNATFNGTITIGSSLAASISGSAGDAIAGVAASASAAQSTADTGVSNAATAQSTANTANTAAGNASTLASNLAAGSVASASAAQTAAESTAAALTTGAVASASAAQTNAEATAAALSAGAVASASAAQTAAELHSSNLAAGARASASAASAEASAAQSAIDTMETQVVLSSAGMDLRNNSNINVATFGTTTKFFDGSGHADSNRKLQLNADGIFAFGDDTNTFTKVFSKGIQIVKDNTDLGFFGSTVRVGALNQQHVSMSSAGVTFMNSGTKTGFISGDGATIGTTSNAHISASTTDVHIIQDANNKAIVDASGLEVIEGGNTVAQFAATSVIGSSTDKVTISDSGITIRENNSDQITMASNVITVGSSTDKVTINGTSGITIRENNVDTIALSGGSVIVGEVGASKSNVQITSGAINLRNNTTNKMVLAANGSISIGNQFSVDASGNATFAGTLSVGSLPAGTVSGSAQLASAISGSIAGQTGSLDSAISTAQSTANTGVSDAASAQSTANSANTTANNLATQVVIDSNGMSLKNAAADKTLASFGTTVVIGENADDKSRMVLGATSLDLIVDDGGTDTNFASFGAISRIGDVGNEHISMSSTGVTVKDGATQLANFAGTTTVGNTDTEHVEITSTSFKLKDGSTERLVMNSSGISMGNQFSVDSSGNASFSGTLSIGSLPAGTVSGSGQLASAISGSIAGQTGSLDSAISTAQSTANTGVSDAASAQSTANTANSTANSANTTANNLATQVVIDSNGMSLKNAAADKTLASFGTTVVIGENADDKSRMVLGATSLDLIVDDGGTDTNFASFGAVSRIGDVANEHISMSSTGVTVKDGATQLANFAGTTTVGNTDTEHVEITSTSFKLKDGGTTRLEMNSSGISMGNQFSVDSSGNASFSGTLSIGSLPAGTVSGSAQVEANLPAGTVTGSAQLADAISGSSNAVSTSLASQTAQQLVDSASVASSVQVTSTGLNILNASGNKLAEYGSNVFVGLQNAEHVKISSDGLELKDNTTTLGKFASTTTIGNTSTEHVEITSTTFKLKDGSTDRLVMNSDGIAMGDQFSVDSSGNASFSGTLSVGSLPTGTVTGSAQLADAISGSSNAVSTSLAAQTAATLVDSASVASAVQITSDGLNILNADTGAELASYGVTTTVGNTSTEHIELTATTLKLKDGGTTRISMDSSGVQIGAVGSGITLDSSGNATFKGALTIGNYLPAGSVSGSAQLASAISGSSNAVSASLAGQTAQQLVDSASVASAVQITSTGLNILKADDGSQLASYAATTTIGSTSGEHISISSDAFEIKTDADTTVLSASSAGLEMQGTVRANAGRIGPYDIDVTSLRRQDTDGTFNITSSLTANKFLLQANTGSNHLDSRYQFDVSADKSDGINMGFLSKDEVGTGTLDIDMKGDTKQFRLKTQLDASSFAADFIVASRPDRSLTEVVMSSGRNNLVSLNNESHPHLFTNTGKYGKQGFAMAQSGSHGEDPMAVGGDAFYLHMGTVSSSRASNISPITADYLQFEGNKPGMTAGSGQMSAAFSRHTTMQMFSHNHQDDHALSKIYLPWHSTGESTFISVDQIWVSPFFMRLEAVVYKPQNLTSLTPDLAIGLHRTRSTNNTIEDLDSVTITDTFADYTTKSARFTGNNRTINPGQGALLSFQWSSDAMGNLNHHITSVWTVAFDLDHLYDVTEG